MKTRLVLFLEMLVSIALLLSACTLPTFSTPGYTVLLTDPFDGSIWTVNTDVGMEARVTYSSGLPAVTDLTFWANGRRVSDVPPASDSASTPIHWTPTAVGEYLLQVQAVMANGRIAISQPSRICVVDTPLPDSESNQMSGYAGPCPPPAPALSPSSRIFSMAVHASPASLMYQTNPPVTGCATTPEVTFQATLEDLGDRAEFVIVDYELTNGSGSLALNERTASLPTERVFAGSIGFLSAILTGASPTFTWTARAYDRSGAVLAADGPNTVPADPCGLATPQSHVIQPIPTDTPTLTATATSTSTATSTATLVPYVPPTKRLSGCRGYLDANSCKKNGCYWQGSTSSCHPKANKCSSYTDPSSCTSNGCSWDKATSTCS